MLWKILLACNLKIFNKTNIRLSSSDAFSLTTVIQTMQFLVLRLGKNE